jgi:hypothetical protein
MKRMIAFTFAVLLLLGATVQADDTTLDKMNIYLNSLERSLTTDNNGVQFWAMFHLAQLKSENPNMDLSRFDWPLNKIIRSESSEELLTVNAQMTLLYINSNELAKDVKVTDKENPFIFYTTLYFEKYKNKFGVENMDMAEQLRPATNTDTALNY